MHPNPAISQKKHSQQTPHPVGRSTLPPAPTPGRLRHRLIHP